MAVSPVRKVAGERTPESLSEGVTGFRATARAAMAGWGSSSRPADRALRRVRALRRWWSRGVRINAAGVLVVPGERGPMSEQREPQHERYHALDSLRASMMLLGIWLHTVVG
jgi:hypothetical protein